MGLGYEARKVFQKKAFWLILLAAVMLHIFLLWRSETPIQGEPSHAEYRAFHHKLQGMEAADKLHYLHEQETYLNAILLKEAWESNKEVQVSEQAAESIRKYPEVFAEGQDYDLARRRQALTSEALREAETVYGYEKYLDGIADVARRTGQFSIFGQNKNSFSYRNIMKTAVDFEGMRNTVIQYDANRGVYMLLNSPVSDLMLVLMVIFLSLMLVSEEKRKNIFRLLKTTPGGGSRTAFAKLSVLAIGVVGVSLLFFAVSALLANAFYGLGDLTRTIQSVPELMGSTLRLSVGDYLLLMLLLRTCGLVVVGICAFGVAVLCRHPVVTVLCDVVIGALSVALTLIPPLSAWNWLKYLNLSTLVNPYAVWKGYLNLDFFSRPAYAWVWYLVFAAVCLLAGAALGVLLFRFKRDISYKPLLKVLIRRQRRRTHTSLFYYECRKVFVVNKAAIILLLFACLQMFTVIRAEERREPFDHAYAAYMHQLEGPVTEDKAAFLQEQERTFREAEQVKSALQQQYTAGQISLSEYTTAVANVDSSPVQQQAFKKVYARFTYLQNTQAGHFVYDTGYERLFGMTDSSTGFSSSLRLVIVFSLCFCGVFAVEYESGVSRILKTVPRKTTGLKLAAAALAGGITFSLAYGTDIAETVKIYGLPALQAPANSLPMLSAYGGLPLWGYLGFLLAIRLMVCFGVMCLCLGLSKLLKNSLWAFLLSFGVLALPFFVYLWNGEWFGSVGIVPLLTANDILLRNQPVYSTVIQLLALLAMTAGTFIYLKKTE